MRTKVTLVLIFLNAVLFLVIFRFERSWRTESVAREVRRRVLAATGISLAWEIRRIGLPAEDRP